MNLKNARCVGGNTLSNLFFTPWSKMFQSVHYVTERAESLLLIKRIYKHLDLWYLVTVGLFPFLFTFLIIHGYNINSFYVVTGMIIYNGVWYGTLAATVISEDRHNDFLTLMKFGPRSRSMVTVYILSLICVTFSLSICTAFGLLWVFGIHIALWKAAVVSLVAGLISLGTGAVLSSKIRNTTIFNNVLNLIFLVFTYQTIIPVNIPILLYTNPLYYLSLVIRQ